MRCAALAQAVAALNFKPVFCSVNPPDGMSRRLTRDGFDLELLNASAGSTEDASELCAVAAKASARAVVIDGYGFGADYLAEIAERNVEIAVIDDNATGRVSHARLVVNQNIFASAGMPARGLLFGLRYALLKKQFADAAEGEYAHSFSGRVLLTFGGSDPDGLTVRAIEACNRAAPHVRDIDVVVGFANRDRKAIEAAASRSRIPVTVHFDVEDMVPLMQRADLAIIAAGTTMWETLCLGLPMIVVYRDALQRKSVDALKSQDLVLASEAAETIDVAALAKIVGETIADQTRLRDIARRGRELVDGRGATRVAEAIAAFA